jgi:hypothetical protein
MAQEHQDALPNVEGWSLFEHMQSGLVYLDACCYQGGQPYHG